MLKTRTKKFTVNTQGLEFELNGETFTCFPVLDYRLYKSTVEDLGNFTSQTVIDHITSFVEPDQRDRFTDLLEDENVLIPFDLLLEIWNYLGREYGFLKNDEEAKKK